jgi:hypothetical protein
MSCCPEGMGVASSTMPWDATKDSRWRLDRRHREKEYCGLCTVEVATGPHQEGLRETEDSLVENSPQEGKGPEHVIVDHDAI